MRKYKVNRDPEKSKVPSKDQIDKYKDFGRLSHQYEKLTKRPKKPLYKDPKVFIALVLLVIIAFLIADSMDKEEEKEDKQEQKDDQSNTESSVGPGCAMCKEEEKPKFDSEDFEKKSRFD